MSPTDDTTATTSATHADDASAAPNNKFTAHTHITNQYSSDRLITRADDFSAQDFKHR